MTTIHTRQLQQYTQDNYNNTHKTTTTIHTRHLQQYTQDNYNNTHNYHTEFHESQKKNSLVAGIISHIFILLCKERLATDATALDAEQDHRGPAALLSQHHSPHVLT